MTGSSATNEILEFANELHRLVKASGDTDEPNKADVKFVQDMIEHHEMALEMAKKVLDKGKDKWVAKLARGIISAQKKEIDDMKDWLKESKPSGSKPSGGGDGMNM